MQEKKSTIFERMMYITSKAGYKNINELSKALNYKSPEKLYRLERNAKAKPSIDIISDFANLFANENIYWLITGNNNKNEERINPPTLVSNFSTSSHSLKNKNKAFLFVNNNDLSKYPSSCSFTEFLDTLRHIKIPELENGLYRAFSVSDSNMSPTIHKNAIAVGFLIETTNNLTNHNIYIIVTRSLGVIIMRVINTFSDKKVLFLASDANDKNKYPNITLPIQEIIELWELKYCISSEFPYPNDLAYQYNELEAKTTELTNKISGKDY